MQIYWTCYSIIRTNNFMKVSVIIPAFNEEKLLENCLLSLNNQEEKPYEIIVVDNNSTDKTAEIAEKLGAIVLKEHEQGITFARNTGFNAAKGDIIARTDADTRVPKDWIKRIKLAFENDPKLLGYSGSAHFYEIPDLLQLNNWPITSASKFVHTLLKHEGMFGFNMAMRRDTWDLIKDEVCSDDKMVHEDTDLAYHISQHGKVTFDKTLVVDTAPRQIKNVTKGAEYLHRGIKMIFHNHGRTNF